MASDRVLQFIVDVDSRLDEIDRQLGSMKGLINQVDAQSIDVPVDVQDAALLRAAGEVGDLRADAARGAAMDVSANVSGIRQAAGAIQDVRGEASRGATVDIDVDDSALKSAKSQIQDLASVAGGIVVGEGLSAGLGDFAGTVQSAAESTGRLEAKLGTTRGEATRLGGVAQEVFVQNWGGSLQETTDAVATVEQQLGHLKDNGVDSTESLTRQALILRDTFDYDVKESVAAASVMTKNFGVTGQDAFDLITVASQRGGDYSGELLDTLREYSPQFAAMGMSAEEATATLVAGAEAGAWNLDKVGDAMKEFQIRAQDGSSTTAEGFAAIGLNAGEMAQKIAAGGPAAEGAFQATLAGLASIEDPVARNIAGVQLFGTQWEDLGPTVVASMAKGADGMGEFQGATDEAGDALSSNFGATIASLQRRLQLLAAGPIGSAAGGLVDLAGGAGQAGLGFIGLMEVWKRVGGSGGKVAGVLGRVSGAFGKLGPAAGTIARIGPWIGRLMMAVMSLGVITTVVQVIGAAFAALVGFISAPVLIIVGIIAGLIAVGYLVYRNWDRIGPLLGKAWQAVKNTAVAVWGAIRGFLLRVWNAVAGRARAIFGGLRGFFTGAWNAIRRVTSAVWNAIKVVLITVLGLIILAVRPAVNAIRNAVSGAWTWIRARTRAIWNGIKTFFGTVWRTIKSVVGPPLTAIRTAVVAAWNFVKARTTAAWNAVKGAVSAAWNAIKNTVGGAVTAVSNIIRGWGSTLYQLGRDAIQGLINGIVSMAGAAASAVGNLLKSAYEAGKAAIGAKSPSTLFRRIGVWAGQGNVLGIEDQIPAVQRAAKRLALAMVPDAPMLRMPALAGVPGAGATSLGGFGGPRVATVRQEATSRIIVEFRGPGAEHLDEDQVSDMVARKMRRGRRRG